MAQVEREYMLAAARCRYIDARTLATLSAKELVDGLHASMDEAIEVRPRPSS